VRWSTWGHAHEPLPAHANHGEWLALDANYLAHNTWVTAKLAFPKFVSQHCDGRSGALQGVFGCDKPAEQRCGSERAVVVAASAAHARDEQSTVNLHVMGETASAREQIGENALILLEVFEESCRKGNLRSIPINWSHFDQTIRLPNGKGAQNQRIKNAKD